MLLLLLRIVEPVQVIHLHNTRVLFQVGVGVFNCEQMLTKISFVIFDTVVKKTKTNRMWFSDNDTGHHSGQNVL